MKEKRRRVATVENIQDLFVAMNGQRNYRWVCRLLVVQYLFAAADLTAHLYANSFSIVSAARVALLTAIGFMLGRASSGRGILAMSLLLVDAVITTALLLFVAGAFLLGLAAEGTRFLGVLESLGGGSMFVAAFGLALIYLCVGWSGVFLLSRGATRHFLRAASRAGDEFVSDA